MPSISKFVEEITGVKRQINKPLVGENAYIHEAEIHAYCIIKGMWEAMEGVHPHVIGQEQKVIFWRDDAPWGSCPRQIGRFRVRYNSQDVNSILNEIRKRLQTQPSISLDEFDEIVRSILSAEQQKSRMPHTRKNSDLFDKAVEVIRADPALLLNRKIGKTLESVGLKANQYNRTALNKMLKAEGLK